MNYGGFWIRFLAYVVDCVILTMPLAMIALVTALTGDVAVLVAGIIAIFLASLLYWSVIARFGPAGHLRQGALRPESDRPGRRAPLLPALARARDRQDRLGAPADDRLPHRCLHRPQAGAARPHCLHHGDAHPAGSHRNRARGGRRCAGRLGARRGASNQRPGRRPDGRHGGPHCRNGGRCAAWVSQPPNFTAPPVPRIAATPPEGARHDVEVPLASGLFGMEKPGATRARPAVLELTAMFSSSFWIKAYLPPTGQFDGRVLVLVSRVVDKSGAELYDPASRFETPLSQRASFTPESSPVPHFSGTRRVSLKQGANTAGLERVEGTLKLWEPLKSTAVSFAPPDAGKPQTVYGSTLTLESIARKT